MPDDPITDDHATQERFFLDRDNSGHWYLEASWTEPEYAVRISGAPCWVTFAFPRDELL